LSVVRKGLKSGDDPLPSGRAILRGARRQPQ
jgi:hypothetical protein